MTSSNNPRLGPVAVWIQTLLCLWYVGGLFLDGWAHNHIPKLETFFTPWHAVFYSGYLAVVIGLLTNTFMNMRGKRSFREAIPQGYDWALIGAAIFFFGAIGDLTWHRLFGIEADIDALLSPTHLILATGMTLMMSGALHAWWLDDNKRRNDGSLFTQLPMICSLTAIVTIIAFMMQYATFTDLHPMGAEPPDHATVFSHQALPLMDQMLVSAILIGALSLIIRRGKPAFGFITILVTINVAAMTEMRENPIVILAVFFAALCADAVLAWALHTRSVARLRIFCAVMPMLLFGSVSLLMLSLDGIWWSVHMWTGAVVISGMAGLLQSFVAWPLAED